MAADVERSKAWHAAEKLYLTHREKLLEFFLGQ